MELRTLILLIAPLILSVGCGASVELPTEPPTPRIVVETKDTSSAETEPAKPQKVEMSKPVEEVEVTGYLSSIAAARRNSIERIESLGVTQAITFWHAEHGRYPKSHEEFMNKVWKPLQTPLPKIEEGYEYRYFPEDHQVYKVPIGYEPEEEN